MRLKTGFQLLGIAPQIVLALQVAQEVFGDELVVTSVTDGQHSRASLHYAGCAVDLRTRHLPPAEAEAIGRILRERLGAEFDVVVEQTHLHVEWQPK